MTTKQTTSQMDLIGRADQLLTSLCDHFQNEADEEGGENDPRDGIQLAIALCLLDIATSQNAIAKDVIWRGHENSLHRSKLGLD